MTDGPEGPAYRIETARLVLRCWQPGDVDALARAITASVDHLRASMPWIADEPLPRGQRIDLLRRFRGTFDLGEDFIFGIWDRDEAQVLGSTGLHPRTGPRSLEIGYWLHGEHTGQGLASEAVAAVARAGFALHAVDRLYIHCDPRNHASARVAARLGFQHEATLARRDLDVEGRPRDTMIWTMLREEFAGSHAAALSSGARYVDAVGEPLTLS